MAGVQTKKTVTFYRIKIPYSFSEYGVGPNIEYLDDMAERFREAEPATQDGFLSTDEAQAYFIQRKEVVESADYVFIYKPDTNVITPFSYDDVDFSTFVNSTLKIYVIYMEKAAVKVTTSNYNAPVYDVYRNLRTINTQGTVSIADIAKDATWYQYYKNAGQGVVYYVGPKGGLIPNPLQSTFDEFLANTLQIAPKTYFDKPIDISITETFPESIETLHYLSLLTYDEDGVFLFDIDMEDETEVSKISYIVAIYSPDDGDTPAAS